MKPIIRNYAKEINDLHKEVFGAAKMTLEKAIKAGELLVKCKAGMPHGEWMSWMEDNLEFSQQQASRYMRAYDRRDSLKLLSESNFGGWERALIEHKPKPKQEVEEESEMDEDVPPFSEEQEVSGLEDARPEENIVDVEEDQGGEVVEDSVILKQLKKYWAMADSYDKELFIDWLKSRKEIKNGENN